MNNTLYRILNDEETTGKVYNSKIDLSQRKQRVQKLFPLFCAVCNLSLKTDIKLATALRISNQFQFVIDELNQYIKAGRDEVPTALFLVNDEPRTMLPIEPVIEFIQSYQDLCCKANDLINEFTDSQLIWEAIWEYVRQVAYKEAPSRITSCFFFPTQDAAQEFSLETRGTKLNPVEGQLLEATSATYDMNWVNEVPITSTMREAVQYASNYWKGKNTDHPIPEVLVTGTYQFIE